MSTQSQRGRWWRQRSVYIALAVWTVCVAAIFPLSHGNLPFNWPLLANTPFQSQLLFVLAFPLYPIFLMVVVFLLTRRRSIPDMAVRAPIRSLALQEALLLWLYGALVLVVGQLLGRALFGEGIGLHLNGALWGPARLQTPMEAWAWAGYNFVLYALLPYLVFRARGYSSTQLNLKSENMQNDLLVIVVVLTLEAAFEVTVNSGIFKLSGYQLLVGVPLSFILHLLGTGLPIMVFIYAILMPRYMKIAGSATTTVLLGAVSYAALHAFESWTAYDSVAHAALSLIFVLLIFGGPGLIKSFLTVRTGNAWVHLWAYHAIVPHVTLDTPNIVRIFRIR
jgi:hypothetical protein